MPTQKYALEPGKPERLAICWRGSWKRMTVWLDGHEVGTIPDARALKAGQSFPLGDGTTLSVQLAQGFIAPELRLLRDGQPLPRSASDPMERLHVAYATVFLIAGLHVASGLVAREFQGAFVRYLGIGPNSFLFGVVFLLLGFLVRRRFVPALIAAFSVYVLEASFTMATTIYQTGRLPMAGLLVRVCLSVWMYRGLPAIRVLNGSASPEPVRRPE